MISPSSPVDATPAPSANGAGASLALVGASAAANDNKPPALVPIDKVTCHADRVKLVDDLMQCSHLIEGCTYYLVTLNWWDLFVNCNGEDHEDQPQPQQNNAEWTTDHALSEQEQAVFKFENQNDPVENVRHRSTGSVYSTASFAPSIAPSVSSIAGSEIYACYNTYGSYGSPKPLSVSQRGSTNLTSATNVTTNTNTNAAGNGAATAASRHGSGPGPIEHAENNEEEGKIIPTTVWKLLNKWYGTTQPVRSYKAIQVGTEDDPKLVLEAYKVILHLYPLGQVTGFSEPRVIDNLSIGTPIEDIISMLNIADIRLWHLNKGAPPKLPLTIAEFRKLSSEPLEKGKRFYDYGFGQEEHIGVEEKSPIGWISRAATMSKAIIKPGTCGLNNLGNSCYMNSALQCMLHVEELAAFFISKDYLKDINKNNPIGYKGQVASSFGALVESVFFSRSSTFAPRDFKQTMGKYNAAFGGFMQQDTQEFVAFLLDGLHEDLNRILNKPHTEKPELPEDLISDEKAVADLAEQCWMVHKQRNDSVLLDLFCGLYRSTLVCPECTKVSITFDPFMDLTLPLPSDNLWFKEVDVLGQDGNVKILEIGMDRHSTIRQLKDYVADKLGLENSTTLIASEIYNYRFYRHYENWALVTDVISPDDHVIVYALDRVPDKLPFPANNTNINNTESTTNINVSNNVDVGGATDGQDGQDDLVFAIPVFNRISPEIYTKNLHGGDFFGTPFFITLTNTEAKDEQIIMNKIMSRFPGEAEPQLNYVAHRKSKDDPMTGWNISSQSIKRFKTRSKHFHDTEDELTTDDSMSISSRATVGSSKTGPMLFRKSSLHSTSSQPQRHPKSPSGIHRALQSLPDNESHESSRVTINEISSNNVSLNTLSDSNNNSGSDSSSPIHPHKKPSPANNITQQSLERQILERRYGDHDSDVHDNVNDDEDSDDAEYASASASASSDGEHEQLGTLLDSDLSIQSQCDTDAAEHVALGQFIYRGEAIVCDWSKEHAKEDIVRLENPELAEMMQDREIMKKQGITLDDCLDLFSKAEVLGDDDLWYCSRCNILRKATKTIDLWKVPDIFTIHLKRFSSFRSFRDKLDEVVSFPIEGLDMSKRVVSHDGTELIYDLFAVDNHFGGLGGGHYTAYAKNFYDDKWYYFDDSHVRVTDPVNSVTGAAYLLFYRRRSSEPLGGPRLKEIVESARKRLDESFSVSTNPVASGADSISTRSTSILLSSSFPSQVSLQALNSSSFDSNFSGSPGYSIAPGRSLPRRRTTSLSIRNTSGPSHYPWTTAKLTLGPDYDDDEAEDYDDDVDGDDDDEDDTMADGCSEQDSDGFVEINRDEL